MSIEDDVALLERVPTLRLLGTAALRMLAIGSEQRDVARDDLLFYIGDDADAGFIVQRGAFRISQSSAPRRQVGIIRRNNRRQNVVVAGIQYQRHRIPYPLVRLLRA